MKKIIITVIILLIAGMVVKTLYDAGQFKTIDAHCSCACVKISGLPGPEDITIDVSGGIVFISSDDRRAFLSGNPVQGAIFGIYLNTDHPEPVCLTDDFGKEFHPHGISLYQNDEGETRLFVVNHTSAGHFVEIFAYQNNRLHHLESISHPLMSSPNDLVAVGPRSFYASNDHGNTSKWSRTLEEYLQLPLAYIVYFDGNTMNTAAKGFKYANGINTSSDGKTFYLATTTGRALHVFSRDIATGKLTKAFDIDLKTGADNIERDASGALYVACHPKLLDFTAHAADKAKLSPSQILKITFTGDNQYTVDEIYLNDGSEISGSSVGAPFDGGFFIGQVFDEHILMCR